MQSCTNRAVHTIAKETLFFVELFKIKTQKNWLKDALALLTLNKSNIKLTCFLMLLFQTNQSGLLLNIGLFQVLPQL